MTARCSKDEQLLVIVAAVTILLSLKYSLYVSTIRAHLRTNFIKTAKSYKTACFTYQGIGILTWPFAIERSMSSTQKACEVKPDCDSSADQHH